jgi:hypothetical protein
MTGSEPATIFINERVFRVRPGMSAAEAAAQLDPELPGALRDGTAYLTDARGIGLSPEQPVAAGTIIRVVRRSADTQRVPASRRDAQNAEPPSRDVESAEPPSRRDAETSK